MTRKEEILAEAHKVAKKAYRSLETFSKFSLIAVGCDMAEWADSHPRKGLVDIEKVCKWIDDNIGEYCWSDRDMEFTETHIYNIDIFEQKAFIKDLRKAMEE